MTNTGSHLRRLGLDRNPFPPATTGPGFVSELSLPDRWEHELHTLIGELAESEGDRVLVIEGGYGSGKTFILNWIQAEVLPQYRVKPYFFENPGVAFYDLANRLMRQVGRYEMAKALWEMLGRPDRPDSHPGLFSLEFRHWLNTLDNRKRRNWAIQALTQALRDQRIATDEEILNKLARLIVETGERPYFEYRDFVPRSGKSLVAEQEEPGYFQALVRILGKIGDADGIAFLLDEFEDVALTRRLSKTQAASYTTTLRRLLDTAQREDLWIILSTTPEGLARTSAIDQSFVQRVGHQYSIPELSRDEAHEIVAGRLRSVRQEGDGIDPFAPDALGGLAETSFSSPRRLIKIMWHALGLAAEREAGAPLPGTLVEEAEKDLYAGTSDQ